MVFSSKGGMKDSQLSACGNLEEVKPSNVQNQSAMNRVVEKDSCFASVPLSSTASAAPWSIQCIFKRFGNHSIQKLTRQLEDRCSACLGKLFFDFSWGGKSQPDPSIHRCFSVVLWQAKKLLPTSMSAAYARDLRVGWAQSKGKKPAFFVKIT